MKELIGKKITGIWIDGDEQRYLTFVTDAGSISYEAEGDCCSESWFYHIVGVDALIGHTVTAVEEIGSTDPDDEYSRQDVDLLYCVKLTTTGGMADVEFRNSSNGYYGGWLEHIDEQPGGANMVEVTGDYIAQLGQR